MIATLLAVHIIFCAAVYLFMRLHILLSSRALFPIVLLVPVWGAAVLAVNEIHIFTGVDARESGVDRLLVEDEIYKTIPVDNLGAKNNIAPINEILMLNDSRIRREIILDVLYDNPADYISQLQLAKENDDTEIVHYAVTALVELQKDYDLKFWHIESKMSQSPDDEEIKKEYFDLLEQYVESGLIESSSRAVYVEDYCRLLSQQLEVRDDYKLYQKKFKAEMELKNYDEAYRAAFRMTELWPDRETGYMMLIEYYAHMKDRKGIDKVLEDIRTREVFLSPKGRSVVNFWQIDA